MDNRHGIFTRPRISIFQAVEEMQPAPIRIWIQYFNENITQTNENGLTPLQLALTLPQQNALGNITKANVIAALLESPQYKDGSTSELQNIFTKGSKQNQADILTAINSIPTLVDKYTSLLEKLNSKEQDTKLKRR